MNPCRMNPLTTQPQKEYLAFVLTRSKALPFPLQKTEIKMAIQVILSQAGPLPISATFESPSDDTLYLEVNGSVWTQVVGEMIGIAITLDGTLVGTAQIYSNGNATHRSVVPAYISVQLGEGPHTLQLTAGAGGTVSDINDLFTAVLHY